MLAVIIFWLDFIHTVCIKCNRSFRNWSFRKHIPCYAVTTLKAFCLVEKFPYIFINLYFKKCPKAAGISECCFVDYDRCIEIFAAKYMICLRFVEVLAFFAKPRKAQAFCFIGFRRSRKLIWRISSSLKMVPQTLLFQTAILKPEQCIAVFTEYSYFLNPNWASRPEMHTCSYGNLGCMAPGTPGLMSRGPCSPGWRASAREFTVQQNRSHPGLCVCPSPAPCSLILNPYPWAFGCLNLPTSLKLIPYSHFLVTRCLIFFSLTWFTLTSTITATSMLFDLS